MASSAYVSLLLLLVVAPQLSGIQVSEPGEISVFGIPTLSMTVDPDTLWFGEVIDAVETKAGIQQLSFLGGKFKRFFLQRHRRLIQLVLLGPDGSISTKLLFRFSNLYLIGFANRDDHWFVMKGAEDLMPGATVLPFGYKYKDLLQAIEGSTTKQKLANLALGKAPTLEAVSTLGTNDPSNLNPKVPSSLGLFAVTVAESLRFLPIREKIGTILESGTIGYLDEKKYNDYINNWAKISMLLLCSLHGRPLGDFRGYNDLKDIHIVDDQQAINVIAILLRPSGYDPEDPEASCDDR
ncbi:unnamed protein product [Miscanthus lutarioriparius]|uniref:rRNA N-glycosylase n=1 Tax=Miscanthus lutarioriparius TaxID=422564 RepID=A0A811N150_9POAL|nr:unnamed protein product [Miscanthus lutarioriparius]